MESFFIKKPNKTSIFQQKGFTYKKNNIALFGKLWGVIREILR